MRDYQQLEVWKRSMGLVMAIYRVTQRLPEDERFGFVAQLRRTAVSVPSNIAEGFGRQATGEYRHHLSIARGSLLELETQLLICEGLAYTELRVAGPIRDEIRQLSRMLATLVAKLR